MREVSLHRHLFLVDRERVAPGGKPFRRGYQGFDQKGHQELALEPGPGQFHIRFL